MTFNDAYKEWRNRARKYRRESVVRAAMRFLQEPTSNLLEDMQRAPWQLMLLVKWVCQDKLPTHNIGEDITPNAFDDLRQRLWEVSDQVNLNDRDTLPIKLFFRQVIHAQIGFQRAMSPGFLREAALLAQQGPDHPLRRLFEKKIGIDTLDFADLAFATYAAILDGKRKLDIKWFESLRTAYGGPTIPAFLSAISLTYPELVAFCRALPDSQLKVASELYEYPVVRRYPFLRTGDFLECWHPAVFYRGMESFVHSVLSEEGQNYMDCFSKLFEQHVVGEARKLAVPYLTKML